MSVRAYQNEVIKNFAVVMSAIVKRVDCVTVAKKRNIFCHIAVYDSYEFDC